MAWDASSRKRESPSTMDNQRRIKVYLAMFIRILYVEVIFEPITNAFLLQCFSSRDVENAIQTTQRIS